MEEGDICLSYRKYKNSTGIIYILSLIRNRDGELYWNLQASYPAENGYTTRNTSYELKAFKNMDGFEAYMKFEGLEEIETWMDEPFFGIKEPFLSEREMQL